MPLVAARRLIEGEHPLKVWREHRGLTQKALAAEAGTSALYLSQIERGRRSGSTKLLRRLADALGVEIDDLVVEDVPKAGTAWGADWRFVRAEMETYGLDEVSKHPSLTLSKAKPKRRKKK